MKLKKNLSALFLFLTAFLLNIPAAFFQTGEAALHAEEIVSQKYLFSADIPEGFVLAEQQGSDRFRFQNTVFPAEFQSAVYPAEQFAQAGEALNFVARQIGSSEEYAEFTWRGRKATLAKLDFNFGKGWASAAELPQDKGWLVVISYSYTWRSAATFSEEELELFHLSVLDSFLTGLGNAVSPGIVTSFAFPEEGALEVPFKTNKSEFTVPFDKSDAQANQYVVDREFLILTKYTGSPLTEAAWKRFYRIIYRDAWKRMEKASFIIGSILPRNPVERASELIDWLFSFEYTRDFEGSDFTSLPEAFAKKTGDCDTRSLLFVLLMRQTGTDAALLVSPEFSHSVAAVDLEIGGPVFIIEGKELSAVDLTSSKTAGRLSSDMADANKWFAVTFRP